VGPPTIAGTEVFLGVILTFWHKAGPMRESKRRHCLFIVPAFLLFFLNQAVAAKIPVRLN